MGGRNQSIVKMVGAIIHSKICYLSLTKEIQSFFLRNSKLCFEAHCSQIFMFEA